MNIPHYRQQTVYSCGPASMRMALASQGIRVPERKLRDMMRTVPHAGTKDRMFGVAARHFGLRTHQGPHRSFVHMRRDLDQGHVVIVCFINEKDESGHYAVVKSLTPTHVILQDPWNGPGYKLTRSYFKKVWHDSKGKPRWYCAIRRNPP
ncbi:C39 family peptidase [Candidatus Woesearchaeota archaeon]|nr:C39 family peptidase [Candidatus Woesearchaeota archaeon]